MTINVECFAIRLSDIKDIVVSIAAVVTATVAIVGIYKWKAELKGKAYFEASKTLAKALYRLRREIGYCRSPFIPPAEFPEGYSALGATTKERADAMAHVYNNRWKQVGKALTELEPAILEAEALWGNKINEAEKSLDSIVSRLKIAITAVVRDFYREGRGFSKNEDYAAKMERDAYASWDTDEPDNFNIELEAAVKAFESIIIEYLRRS